MSIPTSGLAALLVVATFALSSCGSDDGTATATSPAPASGSTVVQTVTQTATATAGSTTSTSGTATPAPTTTQTASTPKPATTTSSSSAKAPATSGTGCGPVELGIRDGEVESTFGRITEQKGVSCATATYLVAQWGSQRLGIDKALLPLRWSCSKQNVCTNGAARVAFVLEKQG